MGDKHCYAAVDIGASSGRVLVGWVEGGVIHLEEVHRFDNVQRRVRGHDCWNTEMLLDQIVCGLARAGELGYTPVSVGIDTWAVDFVLVDASGEVVGDAVAYRDARTDGAFALADALVDPSELYARTGIQRQPFNTIYQLLALAREHPDELERADRLLMVPDWLNWRLTGVMANEYTNATTTGLLDADSDTWDTEMMARLGIPERLFCAPTMPGTSLGHLVPEVRNRVGFDAEVVLPATHDTGSAYLAVPAEGDDAVFLSSGTWSLMGVESPVPITTAEALACNFTNEGGYQRRFRFLKNIMGLWMIQSVRRELNGVAYVENKDTSVDAGPASVSATREALPISVELDCETFGFGDLIDAARAAEPFASVVDVDDARFLSPASMISEVCSACADAGQPVPTTVGEVMRTIYVSLARAYATCVDDLRRLTGRTFAAVNMTGGGCQDSYLCQLTADACNMPVLAGPIEGTGLGNLMVQMIRTGEFADIASARACVGRSFGIKRFNPTGAR